MSTDELGMLADRYTLERVIGRGGMADVYRATDNVLDREVAVKVLRAHAATDRDRARFDGEARTLAQFDHPNLVSVLDAGINDGTPYLVMDLVEGRSLAAACADGPLPARQVALVGAGLAAALAYVHSHAVVHRDLKPGNVLLGSDGCVRLADFGIARLLGDTGQTATGTLIGTAAYLAPEQVQGEMVSPASDIYSLGLLLLESVTGVRAYTGTPTEAALARLHTPPSIPETLSPAWRQLLRAMTDLDPARRPTAEEAGRALKILAEPGAPSTPVLEMAERAPEPVEAEPLAELPVRRRRPWLLLAAVVLVVAAVGGVGAIVFGGHAPSASASAAAHVPAGTPTHLQQPLADLHRVADKGPALNGALGRVDDALVAKHWQGARERLNELVRTTIDQRDVGNLTSSQADAIQAAAARLGAELPGADAD
jgi:eukaryotic-like serine/threonine-protein kinase